MVLSEFENQIKIGVLQLGVPSGYLPFFGRLVASVLVQISVGATDQVSVHVGV